MNCRPPTVGPGDRVGIMLKRLHRIDYAAVFLNVLQLFIDAGACVAGFAAAYWTYNQNFWLLKALQQRPQAPSFDVYYPILIAFVVLVVLTFAFKHLYQSRETGLMNMDEASSVLHGLFIASTLLLVGSYIFIDPKTKYGAEISRLIIGIGAFYGSVLVMIGRGLSYKVRRYLQMRGHFFRRVIICGAGESGRAVARKCLQSPKFHILPVAFLDEDSTLRDQKLQCLVNTESLPIAGNLDEIEETVERFKADEVWIALPMATQETISSIAAAAIEAEARCRFIPNLYNLSLQTLTVESMGGLPLLSISPRKTVMPMPMSKRIFDVIFSVLVLLGTLPLWPLIILLIKLTSKGPAVFSQKRVGQGGKMFDMYKFRTMYAHAAPYETTPQHPHDHRITSVGRWLRKLSIDELPQFWNVLRGEMSVVGPRPEMPQIVAGYTAIHRQRLAVKPGITGIWQISADRRNPIHENIDYDLYYIEKQSLCLDLMIILTTGFYGARGV